MSCDLCQDVDGEASLHLKRLSKKDSTTKVPMFRSLCMKGAVGKTIDLVVRAQENATVVGLLRSRCNNLVTYCR